LAVRTGSRAAAPGRPRPPAAGRKTRAVPAGGGPGRVPATRPRHRVHGGHGLAPGSRSGAQSRFSLPPWRLYRLCEVPSHGPSLPSDR
jgi:hypothetical protein